MAVFGVTILRSKLGKNVRLRLCLKARSQGPLGPLLLFVIKNKTKNLYFLQGDSRLLSRGIIPSSDV